MRYNENLDPDDQISMEEKIAAFIFDNHREGVNEGDAQEAGQKILRMVLEKFRPDLFGTKPSGPSYEGLLSTPHDELARFAQEGWTLANTRTYELADAKAALEHTLTQLIDLKAGFPEKELHEPIDTTLARIKEILPGIEDEHDHGDVE